MKEAMPQTGLGAATGRAVVHSIFSGVGVYVIWLGLTWIFPLPDILAVGVAVAVVLAPGAYDYLGRDLFGNRVDVIDPIESDDPIFKFKEGKYTRRLTDNLNESDFMYISRLLNKDVYFQIIE